MNNKKNPVSKYKKFVKVFVTKRSFIRGRENIKKAHKYKNISDR